MSELPRSLRIPLVARILLAMVLGAIVGLWLGKDAAPLGVVGRVIIDMVKALAAPLLLFAILDAFLRTRVRARSGAIMVAISLINAVIAIVVGLTLSNVLRPGDRFSAMSRTGDAKALKDFQDHAQKIDFLRELVGYLPTNVVRPFVDNAIITIIILAVLGGAALRRVKTEQQRRGERDYEAVESFIITAFRAVEVMLGWVIVLIPLAVFAAVATSIGTYGFGVIRGLAAYVGVAVLGLAIQVLVVYQLWIVLVARMPLRTFWSGAKDAVVYAMGAASSMATLPVTLKCLARLKVSPQSARLAACVGTNLNNDGILLYEAMAVLFVAQAYGMNLSLSEQLVAAAACMIAGIGISGVPDAGFISLTIVLATVKLPVTILPVLLTVDWLLGRCRAVTNVTSDMVVAVLLDRFRSVEDDEDIPDPELVAS
ncbi:MAG: Na+/H+ dicarboxylate symporter [Planctomycetota bacterium]|nr:Na+/H+ dicarboxylate symporter [Planctomycetota bacterium]